MYLLYEIDFSMSDLTSKNLFTFPALTCNGQRHRLAWCSSGKRPGSLRRHLLCSSPSSTSSASRPVSRPFWSATSPPPRRRRWRRCPSPPGGSCPSRSPSSTPSGWRKSTVKSRPTTWRKSPGSPASKPEVKGAASTTRQPLCFLRRHLDIKLARQFGGCFDAPRGRQSTRAI